MIGQGTTVRTISVLLSASIHLAVGWALVVAGTSGTPRPGKADRDIGDVMVVELIPLDRMNLPEPSSAEFVDSNADPKLDPPLPVGSRIDRPSSSRQSLSATGEGSTIGMHSTPERADARAMADLPSSEVLAYRSRLQSHLARYRLYPPSARSDGAEGVVQLHFVMDRQGRVADAWIESSSGVAEIDREALAAVFRAQPLPPLPTGWPERLDISVPIAFKLG